MKMKDGSSYVAQCDDSRRVAMYFMNERKKQNSTRRHDSFFFSLRHNARTICSAKHNHKMPTQYERQHEIVSKWNLFHIYIQLFSCRNY